jgi:hypothetical protein
MRRGVDPAERNQWRGCEQWAADFVVDQAAGFEKRAFAHQHAHEQRPRCLWQAAELREKAALVGAEHVGVALGEPCERTFEIQQVVKRPGRRRALPCLADRGSGRNIDSSDGGRVRKHRSPRDDQWTVCLYSI